MTHSNESITQSERVPLVVAVTGHRKLPTDGPNNLSAPIVKEVREFFDWLQTDYPSTPKIVLSAFSPGADCLVAKLALEAGIRVVPILPVPIAEHIAANEGVLKSLYPFSVEKFADLLEAADIDKRHIVIPQVTCEDGGISDENSGVSSISHLLAGVFAARYCQILLALWDGARKRAAKTGGSEIGGTAQNVHFQRTGDLPGTEGLEACLSKIDEPYAIRRSLLDAPETGLVYHIDTRVLEKRKPHDQRFLGPERKSENKKDYEKDLKDYVRRFKKIYRNIDDFNHDALKLLPSRKAKLKKSASCILKQNKANTLPEPLQELRSTYAAADVLAVHFRDVTHRTLAAIFWLVGVAAASFLYYAHMAGPAGRYWLLGGYVLLLAVAIVLYLTVRMGGFQDKYQDYRALAEGVRVEFFWRVAGLTSSASDYYLRKHKNELDWIRGAVRSCALLAGIADDKKLPLLLKYWIGEQEHYFEMTSIRYHHRRLRLREIGGGALLVSFGLAVYVLIGSPTLITKTFGIIAAIVLLAFIVFNLQEIALETEEVLEEQSDAAKGGRRRATRGRAKADNADAEGDESLPGGRNWKSHAASVPVVLPYAVSLSFSAYCLVSDLKGLGLYHLEFLPAKLLLVELLPGLAVLIIGGLHLIHLIVKPRNRRRVEKLISSTKNSLYGINLGLLIMLALLLSHAILPPFLSHLLKEDEPDSHDKLVAAMGLTALVAAMLHTYAERRALAEQHKLCKRMKDIFVRAKFRLEDLLKQDRINEARELVRELGKEELEEHGDWVMLHRERPIELPRAEI